MAEMNESQEIIKDGGRLPIYVLLDTSSSMAGSVDELKHPKKDRKSSEEP